MADNFRIHIEDTEGNGNLHGQSEERKNKSALPNQEPASGNKSYRGDDFYSTSSKNTSIELENNSSSFERDVSKEAHKTNVDVDVYSENPVGAYDISESDAEYAEMVAALGDAYGKIFNVDIVDAQTSNEGLGLYDNNKQLDPNKMNALAKQLIYSTLNDVLSDRSGPLGPGSNNGGNGGGKDDGYSSTKDGSDSTISPVFNVNLNTPASSLGDGTNPYVEVLSTIDSAIDKLYTDYTTIDENTSVDDTFTNPPYSEIKVTGDIDQSTRTSKWDLRAMPDAMSNMYDVYFRIVDNDTDVDGKQLTPGLAGVDSLFGSRLLSARISSIEIPAYERQTVEVSAWGGKIARPTDSISTPGQSSFSIRGDTRLLYIDFMNTLSGTPLADYFNTGSVVFDLKDKLVFSKTENYIRQASDEAKKAREAYDKAVAEIKKQADEELQAARDKIVSEYVENLKNEKAMKTFKERAAERAEKQGIPIYAAELELMNESDNAYIATLKSKLEKAREAENDGSAESFWAFQKEKASQMTALKQEIRKAQQKMEERDKALASATKEASKNLRNAKNKKNAQVVTAYLRNRPAALEDQSTEAIAYVTGALARNISVRAFSKPFTSFEDLSDHKRVDIIVRRVPQGERFTSIATPKKDERFIFEDVKLLGTSNGIQFKRESADTQDFTYNFIYKRFYKLDYYAEDPAAWVNSQLDKLATWCVDWLGKKLQSEINKLI
jgi:hypothetical protein